MSGHVDGHRMITAVLVDAWREILQARPNASVLMHLRGKLDPEIPAEYIECPEIAALRADVDQLLADTFAAPSEDLP